MKTTEQIDTFLNRCIKTIKTRTTDPVILEGAETFEKSLSLSKYKSFSAKPLPVVNCIKSLSDSQYIFNIKELSDKLYWRPSPRTDKNGEQMALCIFNDMLELDDLMVGLMLIDKQNSYPLHQHNPQEIYLVLSGEAEWRYGGSESFKKINPGNVIYNHPNDIHGVNTMNEPVLALYILWN